MQRKFSVCSALWRTRVNTKLWRHDSDVSAVQCREWRIECSINSL